MWGAMVAAAVAVAVVLVAVNAHAATPALYDGNGGVLLLGGTPGSSAVHGGGGGDNGGVGGSGGASTMSHEALLPTRYGCVRRFNVMSRGASLGASALTRTSLIRIVDSFMLHALC
jgi:hypothetical protein